MEDVFMKCGHTAQGTHQNEHDDLGKDHPCCLICDCCEVVKAKPDLTGRTARCDYFGREKPRRRFANDECNYGCEGQAICQCGNLPSDFGLAFFEHKPNEKQDKFYCGCHGWD